MFFLKILPVFSLFCSLFALPLFAEELVALTPQSLRSHPLSSSQKEKTPSKPSLQFSWQITSRGHSQQQVAYQILLAKDPTELKAGGDLIWDSQKVNSADSLYVSYSGSELEEEVDYHWKLRLWASEDNTSNAGPWSKPATFRLSSVPATKASLDFLNSPPLANFHSSNDKLNSLYQQSLKAITKHLAASPSFPPEGKPWGASAQLTARSYAFQYDLTDYYRYWLAHLAQAVQETRLYPPVFPKTKSTNILSKPSPGYSDAALIIPFALWQMTGNLGLVQEHFEDNVAYVGEMKKNDPLFQGKAFGQNLGDYGHQDEPISHELLSTCYFGMNCRMLIESATASSHLPYIIQHSTWFEKIRKGFKDSFIDQNGMLKEDSQTAQILALRFSLLPPETKALTTKALVKSLRNDGFKAGIFGAGALLPVLSWTGHSDDAYAYIHHLTAGKSQPTPVELAAASEWMLSFLAGFSHTAPGFRTSRIAPYIPSDEAQSRSLPLSEVKAHHVTPYGKLAIHWKKTEKGLVAHVTIPPNTSCVVALPTHEKATITEGAQSLDASPHCQLIRYHNGRSEIITKSGSYSFTVKNP